MPTLVGMNMSFLNFCALFSLPDWDSVLGLPVPERMEKLRDPKVRIFLEERAASPDAGVFSRLTGWGRYRIGDTHSAANEGLSGRLVSDIARERGVRDFFALVDIVLNDDLRTVLWPSPTDDDMESWRMRAEAWDSSYTLIGGSDAGAHLDRMCGAPYTTDFIGDCIRGRQLIPMERAIRHLTDAPARLFGLKGRGRLAEGWAADVVLFDPETIGSEDIHFQLDLPGGAGRLYAGAIGVEKVFVNGRLTVDGGKPTGDLPGVLLRSGSETETVLIPAAG
jgi:N-acyl-D-aspartate/D-glutamate deacylase